MFLKIEKSGWRRDGQQFSEGDFLILAKDPSNPDSEEVRCLVRRVSYYVLGNFMTGRGKIGNAILSLSGVYGNDGLPVDLTRAFRFDGTSDERIAREYADKLFASFHPLPQTIQQVFWTSEESVMELLRAWALENQWELRLRRFEGQNANERGD